MRKPNLTEETPPERSGGSGEIKGPFAALGSHPSEHRDELRRERELRKRELMPFCAKPDHFMFNIHLGRYVDVCLRESAPLVPSDEVASEHPLVLACQSSENPLVLDASDARFASGWVAPDAEPLAGVGAGEPAGDSLAHDSAEKLKLEDGGVFTSGVCALGRSTAPCGISSYSSPVELPGDVDSSVRKERSYIMPRVIVSDEALAASGVTLRKEARHPYGPRFWKLRLALLRVAVFARKITGFPCFVDRIAAHTRRALYAAHSSGLDERHPPEGRAGAAVE